eukprot:gene15104-26784_t
MAAAAAAAPPTGGASSPAYCDPCRSTADAEYAD